MRYASLASGEPGSNCEYFFEAATMLTPFQPILRRISGAAVLLLCAACDGPSYERIQGETMGTYYSISYRASASCRPDSQELARTLDRINGVMSTYLATSELSLFNASRDLTPTSVSNELWHVLRAAATVHLHSGGAFDVTVGPLVNLWGFGPARVTEAPTSAAIADARSRIGMDKLNFGEVTVAKEAPDLYVDLSALAKGYAVDVLAAELVEARCRDFMVDIGGELRVRGESARGGAWRVGIEVPAAEAFGALHNVVALRDLAVATSGDYRNFRVIDGVRVDHVIDPRSGEPADNRVVSVTVIHPEAMYADAYATAIMVLGAEDGIALADNQGFATYILSRIDDSAGPQGDDPGFEVRYNDAMQRYLIDAP